jgi:hypothetical protein
MPALIGGPLDGKAYFDPALDPGAPPSDVGPPAPEESSGRMDWAAMPEAKHFMTLLDGARALIPKIDSEQDRLMLEKVTTMLQQIKASEEKEQEGMLQGKASPRQMRRAYGGATP